MLPIMDYEEFDIRFETDAQGDGAVRVTSSPAGTGWGPFAVSSLAGEIEAYRQWRPGRGGETSWTGCEPGPARESGTRQGAGGRTQEAPQALGRALFAAVFSGQVLDLYRRSVHYLADERARGLRLRLTFDPSSPGQLTLCSLPWELLCSGPSGHLLALDRRVALVRQLDRHDPIRRPVFEPPVRVLLVASNPLSTRYLGLGKELDEIRAAWRGHGEVSIVTEATVGKVRAKLQSGPFHYLHFVGHGDAPRPEAEGAVVLDHPEGGVDRVTSHELITLVRDHASLRLVVVNACFTGAVGSGAAAKPISAITAALILADVPSVVGHQRPIGDAAAIAFGAALHTHLAAGDPIEVAVTEARHALYGRDRGSAEWAVPTLYCQLELGEEPPWPRERSRVRRLLETLGSDDFGGLLHDLGRPSGHGPAVEVVRRELPAERRQRAEQLMGVAAARGEEGWIALQESMLAVRSPFSPFDGSLEGWVARPRPGWSTTRGRLMGLGSGGAPFRNPPDELQDAALLTWEQIRFRDGELRVRLHLPLLPRRAGAGLLLRFLEGRGSIVGVLRSAPGDAACAELWQVGGLGWHRLAAKELDDPAGDGGWHDLALRLRGRDAELRVADRLHLATTVATDEPAGYPGLVRFGGTAVEARGLLLTVWARASGLLARRDA